MKKINKKTKPQSKMTLEKAHPWRSCPLGEHWVINHSYNVLSIIVFFGMTGIAHSTPIQKHSSKYPFNLLTPGHGIVTEDDLAYDNFRRQIGPYDPEKSLSELYWQCVPAKDSEAGFKAWAGPDGMGPQGAIYTMCTINITVRTKDEVQTFADRRAHQVDFCLNFVKKWKQLTKDQKFVCLDGEGGRVHDGDKNLGRSKLWTWDKFKTKKGCYSFFGGGCETAGCDRGKGACRAQ